VKWSHDTPSPSDLAAAGFYFDPTPDNPDNVTCFHCQSSLDGWEPQDDAAVEHLLHSADCAWAKIVAKPWNKFEISELTKNNLNPHGTDAVNFRLETFADWPHESKKNWAANGLTMAKAGFYFNPVTDEDDTTSCPYCEISLGGWEPEDSPQFEHQKRSPNCLFFTVGAETETESPRGRKRASSLSAVGKDTVKKSRNSHNVDGANITLDDSEGDLILKLPKRTTKTKSKNVSSVRGSILREDEVVNESTPEKRKLRAQRSSTVPSEDGSVSSVSSLMDESWHIPGAFPKDKKILKLKSKKEKERATSKSKKESLKIRSVTVTGKDGIIVDPDDTVEEELAQLELEEKRKVKKADEDRREKLLKEEQELKRIRELQKLERERLAKELEEQRNREAELEKVEMERKQKLENEMRERAEVDRQVGEERERLEREQREQREHEDILRQEMEREEMAQLEKQELQKLGKFPQQQELTSNKELPLQHITSPSENWHRLSSSTATTNLQSDRRQKPFSLTSPFSLASPYGSHLLTVSTPDQIVRASTVNKENIEPSTPLVYDDNAPVQSPQKWETTDLAKVFSVLESIESEFSDYRTPEGQENFMDMTVSQWISSLAERGEKLMQAKCEDIIKMIQHRGERAIVAVESIPVKGF
jgi:Inhibitor of Apoptosis domain